MADKKTKGISKERRKLLVELEYLIGSKCYNGNIQNYFSWGDYEGEGREFRYPVTFRNQTNQKTKKRFVDEEISDEMLATGYYAFGANELHIFQGLAKVLEILEERYNLKIETESKSANKQDNQINVE
jgi:hypothetical protein